MMVIDGLIDTLNMDLDLDKGYSVYLEDFGYFRPRLNARSQIRLVWKDWNWGGILCPKTRSLIRNRMEVVSVRVVWTRIL